jgi:uncharacterized protein
MKFFFFLSIILVLGWVFAWHRIIIASRLSRSWTTLLSLLMATGLALQIIAPRLLRSGRFEGSHILTLFLSFTFGLLGFIDLVVFFAIVKDVAFLVWKTVSRDGKDIQRRLFIMRGFNMATIGLASGATLVGTETALSGPRIKTIDIPIKNLHKDLEGFKIVQISDIHVGSLIQKEQVQKIADMAAHLNPDLLVLTGDIADGSVSHLASATEPLKDLQGKFGKFYVTGNHEYYWDVDAWTAQAQKLGFDYLYNENRILNVKSARLLVGGVPDFNCSRIRPDHQSNPQVSIENSQPSDFKILLAHQPKSCFQGFEAGYDLQLSGHTHNGQFFPNNLFVRFFHPYVSGLHLHKGKMSIYVNSGTGFWGPPQRFGVPAEISCLFLRQEKTETT